ncbi:tetratricopeptide repeat protein 36-like protein [Cladochytrium replicatum]|nr:tetratricopeptide repeat protein 36-like protein [Cladochytrium replicatum]
MSKNDLEVLNLIFNPESGYAPAADSTESEPLPEPDERTLAQLKAIELEGVRLAEKNALTSALEAFTKATELWPTYASVYNNRAQLYRLLGNTDAARADLDTAIRCGVGNSTVLKQAYTQRAILRRQQGDGEGAEADFAQGARYGNEVAKSVVKNNPYAKLCGDMVQQAMAKLSAPPS